MLEVSNLSATYGKHSALQGISLRVGLGEIVVILGANGAGKSTLLRAISGICDGEVSGTVSLDSALISELSSDQIVERGIALVPEGRGIFGDLTVKENLLLGAYSNRARRDENANLDPVLKLFPKLQERQGQVVRTMSGGEQQMVAIGRAMMSAPQILMLDEPSLGLSPILCKELFQNLTIVKNLGIGILLVEQNAKQSLAIADRGYLLENTRITFEDTAAKLANDPAVQKAYLGVGKDSSTVILTKAEPSKSIVEIAKSVTEVRPSIRRSANQQIGLDIEDLVQDASTISARTTATRKSISVTQEQVDRTSAPRLSVVLEEIELAAKNARTYSKMQRKTVRTIENQALGEPVSKTLTDVKPPVIEIYRRPRVQIFRRRNGHFERE
ncbi:ABC transporter ATP-binding protein [Planktomarina sp.]|nr:ABC transporter ATP-binding protein [Planktomarina sp.]MDA9100757.1 ABC transporter ATP-binding protein [Planktomarina sp.]|tara:strand:- start:5479 stop:6636 length:1158 start_codon:yes stop_codon:yes gene_type:complete